MNSVQPCLLSSKHFFILIPRLLFQVLRVLKLLVVNEFLFRTKHLSDEIVECQKAHLVEKGYNQQAIVEFFETFSSMVKPTTIQTILFIVVTEH